MEQEELIEQELTLTVQLPSRQERAVVVHGSKPVMDLLVTLCAQYHLNPSDHVIELISTNQNQIKFKPNSLIGSLEAERVVLRPKGSDGNRRGSNMPVPTVRLMINYRKSHKAVVRVNPRVPLAEIMPAVCEKCEFDPDTTVLLRDSQSEEPLDLTKTLNDYGIRDLYAKNTKAVSDVPKDPTALTQGCEEEKLVIMEKRQREKENKGFLSLFRRSKKTAEEDGSNTNSAPTSPVRNNQHGVSMSCLKADSPTPMPSADMPKKRRAPQPPNNMGSQSFPCGLNSSQSVTLPNDAAGGNQGVLTRVSSSESSLKRTKRRAPPPPCTSPSITDSSDKERSCVRASLNFTSLEEDQEEEAALLYSGDSCFNQYSDFTPCLSTHSSSLMTEILSEFMDVMKAEDQGELSPYSSATYLPPAVNSSPSQQSVHGSPDSNLDSGPIAPPGCQLWRNCSQREGLTTFTVVPRRRQMSSRQYEVLITLEASDSLEQATEKMEGLEYITKHGEETLEWRNGKLENLEAEELGKPEPCRHERVTQEKCNGENLESRDAQLGILELTEKGFNKLKLDTDMEKHLAEEMDGQVPVEEEGEEERDWVEEYRERRRRFQGDDQKPVKFDKWMKGFEEELGYTIEDETKDGENGFPLPPCAVAWEENKSMRGIQEGTVTFKTDKEEDKGPRHYPHHEPLTYHVPDPYWDVNHSSNASLNSDAPEVLLTHSDTPSHPNATVDLPSPAPMSLFALAVARRAQTLQKGVWPSTLSTQSFSSQIQPSLHPSGGFISQNQISQRSSHCFPPAQTLSRQVFGSTSTYTAEKGVRG